MSGRRGNGEGSIYHRQDGRWAADYWYEAEGKKKRKTVYAKTRREVAAKLATAQSHVSLGGAPAPERLTVRQYLDDWLVNTAGASVKQSTLDQYRWIIYRYWMDGIGRHRLAQLQPSQVQAVLRSMEERGLSPRTIRQARSILHRALGQAERWGLVNRNVASLTEAPRVGRSTIHDALSATEAKAYLAAAKTAPMGAACTVALLTGLRRGEVLALRWSGVVLDGDEPHAMVKGTLKRVSGAGLVIDTPKTEESERRVFLDETATSALREHRAAQNKLRLSRGAAWPNLDLVFTTDLGTMVDPANFRRRHLDICDAAGIGPRRFHALRHTFATLALEADVPLEVVSKSLGHASLSITADVYAKVGDAAQRGATAAVARLVEGA